MYAFAKDLSKKQVSKAPMAVRDSCSLGKNDRLLRNILNVGHSAGLRVQPKLKIGAVNDKYEKEADRVADQVMRMPKPADSALKTNTVLPIGSSFKPIATGLYDTPQDRVQSKSVQANTPQVSSSIDADIQSMQVGGEALPVSERQFFEARFGEDFSDVRIHTNHHAANTAKSIQARAFTCGNHLVFGDGEYRPGSDSGRHLLAHELTHVLQQKNKRLKRQLIVQRQVGGGVSRPNSVGSLTQGGIDVRRVSSYDINALLNAMQSTAERRRGHGGFSNEKASIYGSGVASRVRRFCSNRASVIQGAWDSGWVDDNGSSRTFNAWNYTMRVTINAIHYSNPLATGGSGTHGSSSSLNSANASNDNESQTNSTGLSAGSEVGAGSAEITTGQNNVRSSGSSATGAGGETFSRQLAGFNRYTANLNAFYTIQFRPGTTFGMENINTRAQTFSSSSRFGNCLFDYTAL
jgi:hypothetical protein